MSSEEKKRGKGEGEEKTKKIPQKINSRGKVGSCKDYLSRTLKSQCELMT